MPSIEEMKYREMSVDMELARAYRSVFGDSDESKVVLADLISHCNFGMYAEAPDQKNRIFERSTVIFRIMSMLNGEPTKPEKEDEHE